MRNFQRDDRSGGRPDMFDAVCAECGKTCQVPFRPSGDKPVYCSDCFASKRGDRDQHNRRDDRRGDRREDRRDRKMYSAICDKCHNACQIPFQPTPGKPIFCEACFGKERPSGAGKGSDQIQQLNAKLDKIINALIEAKIIKPIKEEKKPEVKAAKPEIKKEEKKKAPAKSSAVKATADKGKAAKKKK
jgi:CxxC-x17-CxxC domain-containing protein